jgi:hypothetical protein
MYRVKNRRVVYNMFFVQIHHHFFHKPKNEKEFFVCGGRRDEKNVQAHCIKKRKNQSFFFGKIGQKSTLYVEKKVV